MQEAPRYACIWHRKDWLSAHSNDFQVCDKNNYIKSKLLIVN